MASRKRSAAGDGTKRREQPKRIPDDTVKALQDEILFGTGYKRPPKHSQFKKGQSGNPKGRPKRARINGGSERVRTLILREAERPVTIREGDETKEMAVTEVVLRAMTKSAASGNAYAQKHFIQRLIAAEEERQAEIETSNAFWRDYVTQSREEIVEAERNGETPPALLPHPDDVVIDDEKGVRFIGPINEAQAASLEETLKLRDLLIIQNALDECLGDLSDDDPPGTALELARLFNLCVSPYAFG